MLENYKYCKDNKILLYGNNVRQIGLPTSVTVTEFRHWATALHFAISVQLPFRLHYTLSKRRAFPIEMIKFAKPRDAQRRA